MIYLTFGIIIIILSYAEVIIQSRIFSRYSLAIIFIALVLLAGLRYEVGTDWYAYLTFYQDIREAEKIEYGYEFINNLFSNMSIPYTFFLLFINSISLLLIYLFIRQNSIFVIIGALLFFSDLYLYLNLSGVRQAIAISITCLSINYAIKRQFSKFIIIVFTASLFHLSALVFCIAYFIPRTLIKVKDFLILFIFLIIGYYFLQEISDFITVNTQKNANYYLANNNEEYNLFWYYLIGIFKRLAIIIVFILLKYYKKSSNKNSQYFFNIYLFGFVIYVATFMLSPDVGVRISSYFTIFEIALVGNFVYMSEKKINKILIVSLFSIFSFYKIMGYMNNEFYIYKFIL